ncbi:MAG TPA: hypothetical protein VEY88_19710 [Archangium sp.]|nr:hypothetical protein [Archangium sp.]
MIPATTTPSKLLAYLMRVRRDTQAGRLGMHIGEPNVDRFQGLITGYQMCQLDQGVDDVEYGQFREWLRDKGEFPTEGWEAKYLRDCGGDPEQAIRKYLDFVAEFLAWYRKEPAGK